MRRPPPADRLLLWLFGAARQIFLLQGLAFGCASAAAAFWTSAADTSAWITRALWSGGLISIIFVVAGLLLWRLRTWPPTSGNATPAIEWLWMAALAASLVLIAGATLLASAALPSLWRQILTQLTAIEFWDGLKNPGPYGGIILLPILIALFVPALVTVAAIFSFVFPLILLARLRLRPSLFPTLLAMGAVCQLALVGSGWLATMLLNDLMQAASSVMLQAPDAEVAQVATQLTDIIATLTRTATMLMVPAVAVVSWAVFLRRSGGAAGASIEDTPERPNLVGAYQAQPFVAFSAEAGSGRHRPPT